MHTRRSKALLDEIDLLSDSLEGRGRSREHNIALPIEYSRTGRECRPRRDCMSGK